MGVVRQNMKEMRGRGCRVRGLGGGNDDFPANHMSANWRDMGRRYLCLIRTWDLYLRVGHRIQLSPPLWPCNTHQ